MIIIEIKYPIKILNRLKAIKIETKCLSVRMLKLKDEKKKHLEVVNECASKLISIT